jgi:hypothetical protein
LAFSCLNEWDLHLQAIVDEVIADCQIDFPDLIKNNLVRIFADFLGQIEDNQNFQDTQNFDHVVVDCF